MGVILVRHPRVNAPGLCYGRFDPPLAPGWQAEARRLSRALPGVRRVVSSSATRAQMLAKTLAEQLSCPLATDARLQELNFGTWEGRLWDDIPRAESDPWAEDPESRAPPGGESFADLTRRVKSALLPLADGTLVVTHAGPIRAAWVLGGEESFASAFARPVPYVTALPCPKLA